MMTLTRIAALSIGLWLFGEVHCLALIPLAAKPGQTVIDPKSLPFAALTITMEGGAVPLEEIVFENVATHQEARALLAKTFSDKVDYLTALEPGRRLHAQIILRMEPGRYAVKNIGFYLKQRNHIGSAVVDFAKIGRVVIDVRPGVVNYCGSLVISTDWAGMAAMSAPTNKSVEKSFATAVSVEKTQARDVKWACDVIPALRNLPSNVSFIEDGIARVQNREQPQALTMPVPAYPAELKEKKVAGVVVVDFEVEPDGRVSHASIVSSPHPVLGSAVLRATADWRFLPKIVDGTPVPTHLRVPITFDPPGR